MSGRCNWTGILDDLEANIATAELAVSVTSEDYLHRLRRLHNFGIMLSDRYNRNGNMDPTNSKAGLRVSATHQDDPDRPELLNALEKGLSARYNRTRNMDDLEAAIAIAELAVSAIPEDHFDRARRLNNLGIMLSDRYYRTGNMDDLEAAISKAELAVVTTPEDHPDRAGRLNNLGNRLSARYYRTGNMEDLDAAISKAEIAVSTTPEDHPDRVIMLNSLGNGLSDRFDRTGNINDLEAAISKAELALMATSEDHPFRAGLLNNLGKRLSTQYTRTGNMEALKTAISKTELAVNATPKDHPHRAKLLSNLGIMLSDRYDRTGNIEDLEAAISKADLAVSVTPEDHPDRAGQLGGLGTMLSSRYHRTGNMDDLAAAISKAELAVSAIFENHLDRRVLLNALGIMLSDRYDRTGNMEDLEAAIAIAELAISVTPEDHPLRAGLLKHLGTSLLARYDRTGNMEDLKVAISKAELAVSATPEDHPWRALMLNTLGIGLLDQYYRTGSMDNLEAAIAIAELAVSTTPEDHPDRAGRINNLGRGLSARYNRTGNVEDLEAAISKAELAVSATLEDHPLGPKLLSNLGIQLLDRYSRTGNMEDMEAAISKAELAVSTIPEDDPARAKILTILMEGLSVRYNWTRKIEDLEAAISKAELAVSAIPDDHPDRTRALNALGNLFLVRYNQTRNMDDLQTALRSFIGSFDLSGSIPLTRVRSARSALRILISMEKWDHASSLAQAAIKLLPLICGRFLSRKDQQYAIVQISGLAADACSLSLKVGNVSQALKQLEFGRGIILGYLMDGRGDLSKLQKDHPVLADEYDSLRFKAYTDIEAKEPVIRAQLLRERREAASRLEDCLHQIRQVNGFERFLMEPTLYELLQSAVEGPIVLVNATDIRCDAIIVLTTEAQAIALPEMKSKAPSFFQQKLGRYRRIGHGQLTKYERDIVVEMCGDDYIKPDLNADVENMSWLWSSCVQPILKELEKYKVSDSHELLRVWWIGTGIASSLAFHAAGQYTKDVGIAHNSENTLSQIIPSYTPTIKALSYARSCASRAATLSSNETSILVITMPTTPENRPLPGVNQEKLAIQQMTRNICRIKALETPTSKHVLETMSQFDIIHFACHGLADPKDPSNSHLLLQKSGPLIPVLDKLTVSDISKENTLGQTWIAYLSACSTAGVESKNLADECLHISSAFQIAGFAHVIGSLWPANDDICVRLAGSFYSSLTKTGTKYSNRAVAEALRNAILDIRLEFQSPSLWAAFIHSGA